MKLCPFCKEKFNGKTCKCGAFKVTEEDHDKSFKEIYGGK